MTPSRAPNTTGNARKSNATTKPSSLSPDDAGTFTTQCSETAPSIKPRHPKKLDKNYRDTPSRYGDLRPMIAVRLNSRLGNMSDLLPNAEPLTELLQGVTEPKLDAHALVTEASAASSVEEVDAAIHELIESWRTS